MNKISHATGAFSTQDCRPGSQATRTVKESDSQNVVRFLRQPVQTEDLAAFLPAKSLEGAQLQRQHVPRLHTVIAGGQKVRDE